jgi:hypothetical protein
MTQSHDNSSELEEVVCFKWDTGKMYEIGLQKNTESVKRTIRYTSKPTNDDINIGSSMKDIDIKFWYPTIKFPLSLSFPASFLQAIGGNNFSNLGLKEICIYCQKYLLKF